MTIDPTAIINTAINAGQPVRITRTFDGNRTDHWLYVNGTYVTDLGEIEGAALTAQMDNMGGNRWVATGRVFLEAQTRISQALEAQRPVVLRRFLTKGVSDWVVFIGEDLNNNFQISDMTGESLAEIAKPLGRSAWAVKELAI